MSTPKTVAAAALIIGSLAACNTNNSPSERDLYSESPASESGHSIPVTRHASVPMGEAQTSGEASKRSADMTCVGRNVLFHCETRNNKEIILCDHEDTVDYSFGKVNQVPELSLSVPREQATTFQWQGLGRWINYSVTIPNDVTRYTVFTSLDRIGDDHEFEAGVIVTTDGVEIARILCREPILHNLEGVNLRQDE